MRKNQQLNVPPGYILSRATYKRLGTIVEHLVDCVNPQLLGINIVSGTYGLVTVRLVPFINYNGIVGPVWELHHHVHFNSKLVIDQDMLIPGAEW